MNIYSTWTELIMREQDFCSRNLSVCVQNPLAWGFSPQVLPVIGFFVTVAYQGNQWVRKRSVQLMGRDPGNANPTMDMHLALQRAL
jgi:hypothetical protein